MLHLCGVLARPSARARGSPSAARAMRSSGTRTPTVVARVGGAPAPRGAGPGARRLASTRPTRRARSREGVLAPLTVLTPPREGAAALAPDDARDDTGAGVRAVGGSESRRATRAPAAVASEFPPTPPLITYEQLAPNVELARVADAAHARRDRAHAERTLPVLVGWFGCRAAHLRKYAQMYLSKELGYDAVVCVRPPAAATLFPALGDAFAATALAAVAEAQRRVRDDETDAAADDDDEVSADRPLVLHLFSNGGYLFAGNVMHAQAGFVAETEQTLTKEMSTALRRKLGVAPEPAAAKRFTGAVAKLVVDSAPGELEPGMVAASFEAVLLGKAAPDPSEMEMDAETAAREASGRSDDALRRAASAALSWPPIARRMRYIDAAWGGFPAVTGNRWSGDRRSRPGNAAEVAHAAAERKLAALRLANEDGKRTRAKIERSLAEDVPGGRGLLWCPAMFMYSVSDALIPHKQVEAFATARAQRLGRVASAATGGAGAGGGLVVMRRWDDAPHCEIGRADPEGYKAALLEFLNPFEDNVTEKAVNNIKPWNR